MSKSRPQRQVAYFVDMMDGRPDNKVREKPIIYNAHPFEDDRRMELDIFVPTESFGIEYDGGLFHRYGKKESRKYRKCRDNGIFLYRVKEKGPFIRLAPQEDMLLEVSEVSPEEIQPLLDSIAERMGMKRYTKASRSGSQTDLYELAIASDPEKWTLRSFPSILAQWDYERNEYVYGILPDDVCIDDPRRFYWTCPDCHEQYVATISERMMGTGCAISNDPGRRHRSKRKQQAEDFVYPTYCADTFQETIE